MLYRAARHPHVHATHADRHLKLVDVMKFPVFIMVWSTTTSYEAGMCQGLLGKHDLSTTIKKCLDLRCSRMSDVGNTNRTCFCTICRMCFALEEMETCEEFNDEMLSK